MNIDFSGKTVLVTGAAHGFGRAIALAFQTNGARVYACDLDVEGLAETTKLGDETIETFVLDVGDREAVQKTVGDLGAIDIVVNNAGGVRGQVGRPIEEISEGDWRSIFDVNLSGTFYVSQAAVPAMKARKYGRIINISSGAGLGISLTGIQAYASAKAGQIGLTRQLAHELGPFGITVNNVAPGFVRSNPTTERQWHAMGEEGQARLLQNIAMKRLGAPDDIANAVMFFASEQAGWITGQILSVDGGKSTKAVERYLVAGYDAAVEELKAFCRLPSVSTDAAYGSGIRVAAEFVAGALARSGLPTVEVVESGGHPVVFAEGPKVPGRPTVLVYGHYDVQPPDPLNKWHSPPFEPTIREDRLYARGVSDDKGPLLIPILVARAFDAVGGGLPLNLKFLIEGEEESGSPHFEAAVEMLKERLACDVVVSADGAMWRPDLPSVTVAGRGLAALEVTVHGAVKDLHSGRHGGSAPNAVFALTRMLATLHDDDGNVLVDGFASTALPPDPAIGEAIGAAGFDAGRYFDEIGAQRPAPLPSGEELLARQWLVPTLEFNGISGGYAGPGTKTIIPATASAKITCRLVRGQEPDAIREAIAAHLRRVLPSGYRLDIQNHGPGTVAFGLDQNLPALAIAEDVLEPLLGSRPLRVAMGATIPICGVFQKHLGVGTVFFSFSTSDEDYHAPNEFLRLSNFRLGMTAWTRLLQRLAHPERGDQA